MRAKSNRAIFCALVAAAFLFCALPVSADEEWNCDRISGLSKAFSDPEHYLTFGWIHRVRDIPSPDLAHCVDTGMLGPNGRNEEGWSVLHWAILQNDLKIVTALLRAGADLNARTKQGTTPLHTAVARDNPTVVRELLKAGADVNARNEDGATPLHSVASAANAVALLEAGADVNARTKDGYIPLHSAANQPKLAVITKLLKAGSELNARSKDGLAPLHFAARKAKEPAVVIILLDAGANPKLRTKDGETAFDFATKNEAIKTTDVYWRLNDGRF